MPRPVLPQLFFRVTTSHTAGSPNATPNAFIPTPQVVPPTIQALGALLNAALLGRNLPDNNPFIFITSSLLYALVYAAFRAARGEIDIKITCFDPRHATTSPNGTRRVQFHRVVDLMDEYGVEIKNKLDGSKRTYESEWVALGPVHLDSKSGACAVQWERLLAAGLYIFYPALREVQKASRNGAKLYVALSMLRGFGFGAGREAVGLSEEKIELARNLVSLFAGFAGDRGGVEEERMKGLVWVWFLSLVKRESSDEVLVELTHSHFASVAKKALKEQKKEVIVIDDDEDDDSEHCKRDIVIIDDSDDDNTNSPSKFSKTNSETVPEEQQFAHLHSTLLTHPLNLSTQLHPTIKKSTIPKTVTAEIQAWNAWLSKNREERYAARAERSSCVGDVRPRRREGRHPRREFESRDSTRRDGKGNRAPRPLRAEGASRLERTVGGRVERRPRRG